MSEDLSEFISEICVSEEDVINLSDYIINSFVEEFDYDYDEVKQYYYNTIIPQSKRNIIESKLADLNGDFKV